MTFNLDSNEIWHDLCDMFALSNHNGPWNWKMSHYFVICSKMKLSFKDIKEDQDLDPIINSTSVSDRHFNITSPTNLNCFHHQTFALKTKLKLCSRAPSILERALFKMQTMAFKPFSSNQFFVWIENRNFTYNKHSNGVFAILTGKPFHSIVPQNQGLSQLICK